MLVQQTFWKYCTFILFDSKKLLKLMMLIEDVFAWQLNLEIYIKHAMLENVKWKFDAENEVTWKSITFNL